jgi:hypothetical protein
MAQPQIVLTRRPVLHKTEAIQKGELPSYQAFRILHVGYTLLPIIMGLDKFMNSLTNWTNYASRAYAWFFGGNAVRMMHVVGFVEIAAGLVVLANPKWGARIVALWLAGIILNMLLLPGYFDIALRDFGLFLGAVALSRLSEQFGY